MPTERIRMGNEDCAFVLGKNGATKHKLARVSGANLDLNDGELSITGGEDEVRKAALFVKLVMEQRSGAPRISEEEAEREQATIIDVPKTCIAFVTGAHGNNLRSIEEEWCTLMLFLGARNQSGTSGTEQLVIFGDTRGRRGAELKVLSAVEVKEPGFYTQSYREHEDGDDRWGNTFKKLDKGDMSWALGKNGHTRKKIAASSQCIVEYVDTWVVMSGSGAERDRASEYLEWTMMQLKQHHLPIDPAGRRDVTVVRMPRDCAGYITGGKRAALNALEADHGVLCLFREEEKDKDYSELAIFGSEGQRIGAQMKVWAGLETKKPGYVRLPSGRCRDDIGIDTRRMQSDEVAYGLGKDGQARKKIVRAAGAPIEYVGHTGCVGGTREQRERGMRYLNWLLDQRSSRGMVIMHSRQDLDHPDVDFYQCVGGTRAGDIVRMGNDFRRLEADTGSFVFPAEVDREDLMVLICTFNDGARKRAKMEVTEMMREVERNGGGGGGRFDDRRGGGFDDRERGGYDSRGRGGYDDRRGGDDRRYDDRDRDRYDDRDRDRYDDRDRDRYDDRRRGGDRDRYDDRRRSPPRGRSRSPSYRRRRSYTPSYSRSYSPRR